MTKLGYKLCHMGYSNKSSPDPGSLELVLLNLTDCQYATVRLSKCRTISSLYTHQPHVPTIVICR